MNPFFQTSELYDVWRCQHGSKRDYSYVAPSQLSYSHIDLFIVDKITLQDATIGIISWSDHAPLTLTIEDQSPGLPCSWRLNATLLTDPSNIQKLTTVRPSRN